MEKRFFTVHEANELIPFLSERLDYLRHLHRKLELWAERSASPQDIMLRGGTPIDPSHLGSLTSFQSAVTEICEKGCQLKDIDSGLIDFPTLWEGREVFLCWKLGEPEVAHWHEVEAGFAGRQSLKTDG
jgi:hypothetical protein